VIASIFPQCDIQSDIMLQKWRRPVKRYRPHCTNFRYSIVGIYVIILIIDNNSNKTLLVDDVLKKLHDEYYK